MKGGGNMGKRGPNPKPSKLKVLNGNAGKHNISEAEPQPKEFNSIPEPPHYLDYYAKKEWKRQIINLIEVGLVTKADISMFEEYCQMHAHCVRLHNKIHEEGYEFRTGEDGHYRQSVPAASILNKFLKQKTNLAEQLGLTPAARTNIEVDTKKNNKKSVEEILNGNTG